MPLFDIFSKAKSKAKIKRTSTIIADTREKNSLLISELISLNLNVQFQTLKVGDYLISNIAIERKTLSDFISSILDKRIFRQLEELKQFPKHMLMIEGINNESLSSSSNSNINPNAIRGFLLSILLNYNVPVLFTKDYKDSAKFLFLLANKTKKSSLSIRPSKKLLNQQEQIQYIIEGFPGIGPVKSKKLLDEFKTLKGIINADYEDLKKILGNKTTDFLELINTPNT